jgi:hypothetical protein
MYVCSVRNVVAMISTVNFNDSNIRVAISIMFISYMQSFTYMVAMI